MTIVRQTITIKIDLGDVPIVDEEGYDDRGGAAYRWRADRRPGLSHRRGLLSPS